MYKITKDMSRTNELRVKDRKNVVKKYNVYILYCTGYALKDIGG